MQKLPGPVGLKRHLEVPVDCGVPDICVPRFGKGLLRLLAHRFLAAL